MTNILICGISGKMGGNVLSLLENDPEAKAVCGVDFYPKQLSVPVYKTFSEVKEPVDVIIDFSSPEALEDRLKFAEEKGAGIVLACTGFNEKELSLVDEYSARVAIFKTANLSLGINLMQALCKAAAEVLGEAFDVEIVERHHNLKRTLPPALP